MPRSVQLFIHNQMVLGSIKKMEGQDLENGEKCEDDSECSSGLCCGFLKRKCQNCCRDKHCPRPDYQVCKNNQCIEEGDLDDSCRKGCKDHLRCCGKLFKRCKECCDNEDCYEHGFNTGYVCQHNEWSGSIQETLATVNS